MSQILCKFVKFVPPIGIMKFLKITGRRETVAKSSEVIRNLRAILQIRPSLCRPLSGLVMNRQLEIAFLIAIIPRRGTTKQTSPIDAQIPKMQISSRLLKCGSTKLSSTKQSASTLIPKSNDMIDAIQNLSARILFGLALVPINVLPV
jgi:hypothetical protein